MARQSKLTVFAHLDEEFVPAGNLTLIEENTDVIASEFAYGLLYLDRPNAIEVDPVSLSISHKQSIKKKKILPSSGLRMFGGIRDAAPDAWGRRVIEAKLKVPVNSLPESTYLLEAGSNRIGALDVRPNINAPTRYSRQSVTDLQYLMEAAERIEEGAAIPAKLEAIFDAGSALGGARPKATVRDDDGVLWLAKFQSTNEKINVPEIEAATLKLAALCGMSVPETKVIRTADRSAMLIRRFDRYWDKAGMPAPDIETALHSHPGDHLTEKQLHFVSGLTMLACDETAAREKSYADLAAAVRRYCHTEVIRENNRELFARMVYNIFVSNDDDHPRNHGFLWDPSLRGWRLSPLYDVMPRPTVATERFLFLGVGQAGRLATIDNAMSARKMFSISEGDAAAIIANIWEKMREWQVYFEEFGTSSRSIEQAANAFRHIDDISTAKLRAILP